MSTNVTNQTRDGDTVVASTQQTLDDDNPWLMDWTDPAENQRDDAAERVDTIAKTKELLGLDPSTNIDFCDSDDDDKDEATIYQDIHLFFYSIDEPQLIERFVQQKVTLSQLLNFTEEDLIKCGVDLVGDRKKILDNIAQVHSEGWSPTSLQDLNGKTLLSSPGMYMALTDINKHLEYIGATYKYFKRQVECKPHILQYGKEYVGAGKIVQELDSILSTTKAMTSQLSALRGTMFRQARNSQNQPANLCDNRALHQAKWRRNAIPLTLTGILLCIAVRFGKKLVFRS